MQEIEKECGICGRYFKTINPHRKYCDDCSSHYNARKREYESGLRRSHRRMYEPNVFEITCDKCGRKLKVTSRCLISTYDEKQIRYVFCCERHKNEWKEEHATCAYCGGPMLGTGRYNPKNNHPQYCSEECLEKAKWEIARKEGNVHVCRHCGKEFIRNRGGIFCSKTCMDAARANGWKPAHIPDIEKVYPRWFACSQCRKTFQITCRGDELPKSPVFCSDKCRQTYHVKIVAKSREKS